MGNGKTADGEMKIDLRFTKAVLERYCKLNKSNVKTTCESREANLKLNLSSLDIQIVLSCDAMAVNGQKEISEESADSQHLVMAGGSVLADGALDGDTFDGSSPAPDGGLLAPASPAQPKAAASPDYRYGQP